MTDDLVQFLRARLDEDAAAVRGHWNRDGVTSERFHGTPLDPARVLAEVDAKRRIVGLHELEYRERPERVLGEADDPFCVECCGEGFPCATLRLLALPYAGDPDYREEWRP